MTATSVAPSSLMMSAASIFGQPSRSNPPAFNPFATNNQGDGGSSGADGASDSSRTKRSKRNGRQADQSDNENKQQKFNNPFLTDARGKQGDDKKRKPTESKKVHFNNGDLKTQTKAAGTRGSPFNPFAPSPDDESQDSRPSSSSSNGSTPDAPAINSNDPHARKVYEQLRQDKIGPPSWPSQPGNPKHKAQMSKFREKYESYRDRVRASLTKAGIIDDPTKRKTLQDAIDFKGICEDMCPEYEKITRITENDVHQPEKDPKTTFVSTPRMIKKLARSAAGQEAPLPMDVRSVPALRRTLDYLIDDLLRNDGNLPTLHGFLWDRTRAIRRDFTFFSTMTPEEMKTQVYVLENIARFHVTSLHLLSEAGKGPEDFVEQQELEQLGKALLSLRDLYDDCNNQGVTCENEAEFRAYYLLFHASDPSIMETLQRQWRSSLWRDSDQIRTAVSLVEALQNTTDFHGPLKDAPSLAASAAFNSFFRILEDPSVSYTMACFAECHFPHLRRSILTNVKRALARPKDTSKDVTAQVLNNFLRFDTIQEAIEFAELHDFKFGPGDNPHDPGSQYLILDNRRALPHHRLQHQFSRSLVERKRSSRPLPELIHMTVYEASKGTVFKPATNGTTEESLFVSDSESKDFPTGQSGTSFGGSVQPSSSKPEQPKTSSPNPFASAFAPTNNAPAANPFAPKTLNETDVAKPSTNGTSPNPFARRAEPVSAPPSATNPFAQAPKEAPKPTNDTPSITSISPFSNASPFSAPSLSNGVGVTPFGQPPTAQGSESQSLPAKLPEPTKAPAFSFTPPTPQTSTPPAASIPSFQPSVPASAINVEPNQDKPTAAPAVPGQSPLPTAPNPPSAPPTAKFQLKSVPPQFSTQPSNPSPLRTSTVFSQSPEPQKAASLPPFEPPKPPKPPRDLLGDFTKWFVTADQGLLEEFQVFMLDNILQDVFTKFEAEKEEQRRKEEDARLKAEADAFRVRSISVKYFYRWREIARGLRLSELRRSGREQMRAYREAQWAAQAEQRKRAARQAAREKAELAEIDHEKELRDFMRHRKVSKRQAQTALLASGVLSGLPNEEEVIAKIVNKAPSTAGSVSSAQSRSVRGGSKTQALRDQFLRSSSTGSNFRRSLPPMSSRESSSPPEPRSMASERWRLKAMGIVQLPDGTAVPKSLADEMYQSKNKKPYSALGSMSPPPLPVAARRASISNPAHHSPPDLTSPLATKNKRKRPSDDDDNHDDSGTSAHKRVLSDAANLISELRAMREEMEEGTSWFREQNERLQGEIQSRGSTPYERDV